MPAAPVNDRNPLIKILHMGLLDRQVPRKAGPDGSLDYGLTGRDISALQRTCRAADGYLKMTEQNEVNHLMRVSQNLRHQRPTEVGVRNARVFIARVVKNKCGVGSREVHQALAEMATLGAKLCIYKSKPHDRRIAIIFAAIMHVHSGHLMNPAHCPEWIDYMRSVDTRRYGEFIGDAIDLAQDELSLLSETAAILAVGGKAMGGIAHTAVYGAGWSKVAASVTMPMWPFLAGHGAAAAVACVPMAVGLACKSGALTCEYMAFKQMDSYKDAVAFDLLMHKDSWLLHEHDERDRLDFYDDRMPQLANTVGKAKLRQIFNAYCSLFH